MLGSIILKLNLLSCSILYLGAPPLIITKITRSRNTSKSSKNFELILTEAPDITEYNTVNNDITPTAESPINRKITESVEYIYNTIKAKTPLSTNPDITMFVITEITITPILSAADKTLSKKDSLAKSKAISALSSQRIGSPPK